MLTGIMILYIFTQMARRILSFEKLVGLLLLMTISSKLSTVHARLTNNISVYDTELSVILLSLYLLYFQTV